jgi:hypothetical protein
MTALFTEAPQFVDLFTAAYRNKASNDSWDQTAFHVSDAASCSRRIALRMLRARHQELRDAWRPPIVPVEQEITLNIGTAVHKEFQRICVEEMGLCGWEDVEVGVGIPDLLTGSIDQLLTTERERELCLRFGLPLPELVDSAETHVVVDWKTKNDKAEVTRVTGKGKFVGHTFPTDILKYDQKPYYVQVQSYMGLGMRCYPERYPVIRRAYVFYICKNDGRLFATTCSYDPAVLHAVQEKAVRVQGLVAANQLPPREYSQWDGACRGWMIDGELQYACPYQQLCWNDRLVQEFFSPR